MTGRGIEEIWELVQEKCAKMNKDKSIWKGGKYSHDNKPDVNYILSDDWNEKIDDCYIIVTSTVSDKKYHINKKDILYILGELLQQRIDYQKNPEIEFNFQSNPDKAKFRFLAEVFDGVEIIDNNTLKGFPIIFPTSNVERYLSDQMSVKALIELKKEEPRKQFGKETMYELANLMDIEDLKIKEKSRDLSTGKINNISNVITERGARDVLLFYLHGDEQANWIKNDFCEDEQLKSQDGAFVTIGIQDIGKHTRGTHIIIDASKMHRFGKPKPILNNILKNFPIATIEWVGEQIQMKRRRICEFKIEDIKSEIEKKGLIIDEDVLTSMVSALSSGKHVILEGPPGTGKSTLAQHVAQSYCPKGILTVTGTATWSTYDTIGRYRIKPETGGELQFVEGFFLTCFNQEKWLVLDELNRAEIDKAIGSMFTVLAGQEVDTGLETNVEGVYKRVSILPPGLEREDDENTTYYKVPDDWRMIATMNEQDQHLLFTMSEAFKRRFCIINIQPSEWNTVLNILKNKFGDDFPEEILKSLEYLYTKLDGMAKNVGPALYIDCAKIIMNLGDYESPEKRLKLATEMLIRPHLNKNDWDELSNFIDNLSLEVPPAKSDSASDEEEE